MSNEQWAWLANALVTLSAQVHYNAVKLNKLLELAGEGEELRQLTKKLAGPTKALSAALRKQKQTKGKAK